MCCELEECWGSVCQENDRINRRTAIRPSAEEADGLLAAQFLRNHEGWGRRDGQEQLLRHNEINSLQENTKKKSTSGCVTSDKMSEFLYYSVMYLH